MANRMAYAFTPMVWQSTDVVCQNLFLKFVPIWLRYWRSGLLFRDTVYVTSQIRFTVPQLGRPGRRVRWVEIVDGWVDGQIRWVWRLSSRRQCNVRRTCSTDRRSLFGRCASLRATPSRTCPIHLHSYGEGEKERSVTCYTDGLGYSPAALTVPDVV